MIPASARTAISRANLSAPMRQAIAEGVVTRDMSILDYGCGRGGDVTRLQADGYNIVGYDPHWAPEWHPGPFDVVTLFYVLNVLDDPLERSRVIMKAWHLLQPGGTLAVAVRTDLARTTNDQWTSTGTFQHYYTPMELRQLLGVTCLRVTLPSSLSSLAYVKREGEPSGRQAS